VKDRILNILKDQGGSSIPELLEELGEEARGDLTLIYNGDPNQLLWINLSAEFVDAMTALQDAGRITGGLVGWPLCLVLGGGLSFPIAKQPGRKGGYKKPRWVPAVFTATSVA